MAATTDGAQASVRPMSLRPGGGSSRNPFERFAKGAGFAVKAKAVDTQPYEEKKRKPRSEVKVYTKEELDALQEMNVNAPPELENFPELQINTIEAQRPIQTDDRDWRGRAEQSADSQDWQKRQSSGGAAASKDEGRNKGEKQGAGSQSRAPGSVGAQAETLKIQRAEDIGRTAWQKGATQEGNKRTLKEVKGILNKLTPEKFDLLSRQLLQLVTNTEVLQGTITLIFENAVAQPTFVAVYANLCDSLAKALPESFTGHDKAHSFRRILLNTCQEEFEGAADARAMQLNLSLLQRLASVSEEDRLDAEQKVKQRTLGNIRLIAELFNKGIVAEIIIIVCVEELIRNPKANSIEDNVEALCELMTKAGKKLDATVKNRAKMEGFFTTLGKLSKNTKLPPRIRFMLRDVLDLRRSSWIPRRDVIQAKKIDEIHAEAHAELGMVPTPALPLLQNLPALPVVGPASQDIELFPAFRGGDGGWETVGKLKGTQMVDGKEQSSAFFLEEDPLATTTTRSAAVPEAEAAAGPSKTPAKREPLLDLSMEERESRAKSLFSEYISSRDHKEATECVQELDVPGFAPRLVCVAVDRMLDAVTAKEQQAVAELLVQLVKDATLARPDFLQGLHKHVDSLADLRIDVPVAPKALGYLVGAALAEEGVLDLEDLPELLSQLEEAESKRLISAVACKTLKEKVGEEKLKELGKAAKLDAEKLFAADPEVDTDLPDVPAFIKEDGLEAVFS